MSHTCRFVLNYDFCQLHIVPWETKVEFQADVIVAGSLGGLLRIYSPYRPEPDEDQVGGANHVSSAGNLLLEVQLEDPIFQIAVGRLSSS